MEERQKCVKNIERQKLMCGACRKQHVFSLWVFRDKVTHCGGQEMTQNLEGLKSW